MLVLSLAILCPVLSPDRSCAEEVSESKKLCDEGVEHYRARRYFQAIRSAEAALERAKGPERQDVLTLLARFRSAVGVELCNEGENRQAEETFRAALEQAEDSYAHFGLGMLHFLRLEDEKALDHLQAAARLEPTYGKTQKLLALLEYRQGHVVQALSKIKEACRLDPDDAEARALRDRWDLESHWTGTFREMESGRFFLRMDPDLPQARVEDILKRLEKARIDLGDALGLGSLPSATLRTGGGSSRIVVALFSAKRFHAATGSLHWVGGVYDGQIKFPLEADGKDPKAEKELDSAIRHEMAHLAIREICPMCPNWLNEGLAQYFESSDAPEAVKARLREGASRRIPFKSVPARLWEVDDESLARWSYLQGLGFVEYLAGRFHPFRLRLCLESMTREQSVSKAFELTFGASLEELEARWWKEIAGS